MDNATHLATEASVLVFIRVSKTIDNSDFNPTFLKPLSFLPLQLQESFKKGNIRGLRVKKFVSYYLQTNQ